MHNENIPLSIEPRVTSLQSKYIKFLQFDKSLIDYVPDTPILYCDHKCLIKHQHIEHIFEKCKADILIRNTPRPKLKIEEEIREALGQKRYNEVMNETLNWVKLAIGNFGYSNSNRIMNTGLIYYRNPSKIQELCDNVYQTCWYLGQPECQIIWGILAQKYEEQITRIEWDELGVMHKDPTY